MCVLTLPFKCQPRERPQDENWNQVTHSFQRIGIVGKKKTRGEGGNAEIGRRWKRGNGANRLDKSGCGGEENMVKRREERKMEM